MAIPYSSRMGSGGNRPFLDVMIGESAFRVSGLVDSGAMNTLFSRDVAEEADLDLSGGEQRTLLYGPGGHEVTAVFLPVPLEAAGHSWEAEVGFTSVLTPDFGLLGQQGFFRWFTVTFFAVVGEFEVEPIRE